MTKVARVAKVESGQSFVTYILLHRLKVLYGLGGSVHRWFTNHYYYFFLWMDRHSSVNLAFITDAAPKNSKCNIFLLIMDSLVGIPPRDLHF